MANYTTKLKSWGSTGQEYPTNYSYLEQEAPVDAWDNFLTNNLITDVQDHLIPLTNSRIETDYGASGSEPTSPEGSHLYHNTDDETLNVWNTTTGVWDELLTSDLDGKDLTDGVTTIWDTSAGEIPQANLSNSSVTVTAGNQLTGGGNVALGNTITINVNEGAGSGLDADTVDGNQAADLGSGASDNGIEILSTVTDFNFTNNLSVSNDGDGTVTVDGSHSHVLSDLSDVTATGEGSGNGFNADLLDGNHASAFANPSDPVTQFGVGNLADGEVLVNNNGTLDGQLGFKTMVDTVVDSGTTISIPVEHQLIVHDEYVINGTVDIGGELVIL